MSTPHDNMAMPDTPITIKVALNDVENKRFKLALGDLGANTLPAKLRSCLGVPPDQAVLFERFSDSAGAFIKLDSNNTQVYKQLHRAAKAKFRLRIRATYLNTDGSRSPTAAPEPTPVTTAQPATALSSNTPGCAITAPALLSPPAVEPRVQLPTRQKPVQVPTQNPSLLDMDVPLGRSTLPPQEKQRLRPRVPSARVYPGLENLVDGFGSQEKHDEAPVPAEFSEYTSKPDHSWNQYPMLYHPLTAALAGTPDQSFSIHCNRCDMSLQGSHWHCSICDNGDFDLCQSCFAQGVRCNNADSVTDHWLIQRSVKDGKVVTSDTERYTPKKDAEVDAKSSVTGSFASKVKVEVRGELLEPSRTCNACIGVFNESKFVTCTKCEDYDLCIPCHMGLKHGHHPGHPFVPASDDATLDEHALNLCSPGRDTFHRAVCDGCDKNIRGIRHKCMNCPDFDYCSTCVASSHKNHPGHAFIPVYESLYTRNYHYQSSVRHYGIQCDGPLCMHKTGKNYIVGDRYKCAVCHDTDFCAACEALPTGHHNKTHPLIKIKTPIRSVTVSAIGQKDDGEHLYTMGDRLPQTSSKSTETAPAAPPVNAATQVQTMAEVPPTVPAKQEASTQETTVPGTLQAVFVNDTIPDGSSIAPGATFQQVWTLRNDGPSAWPAGCAVRFIGGNTMFDLGNDMPIPVSQLAKAQSSNVVDRKVQVGEDVDFAVTLRAAANPGKLISYWRLKTADGLPFGHKLWCDVNVEVPKVPEPSSEEIAKESANEEGKVVEQSQMIFPKLDKESPVASLHEAERAAEVEPVQDKDADDEPDDVDFDDESSEDAFLTDEEYEMLSADEDEIPEAKNGKK